MSDRKSCRSRDTKETKIEISVNIDGTGESSVNTGVGFFDHMLTLFSKHSLIDIELKADGDLEVDAHHTVEDVGLLLGSAILEALGDKKGICRYGFSSVPMDESGVEVTLDLSGRPHLVFEVDLSIDKVGDFDTCLGQEFFQALTNSSAMNLHVVKKRGENPHHVLEAAFKAAGRALRQAVSFDSREKGIPSSKGVL
ncbi:MAG: imidazoleglycerol-phosphate dehydratase HisB [Planctomycetota bacterium]|jgi:imidazoleglycerol-phosphate dehydratase